MRNFRIRIIALVMLLLLTFAVAAPAIAGNVPAPVTKSTQNTSPSFLGQDGQIWNASSVQMGIIKKWPGTKNYDAVLPAGRWSSSYPLYLGDVDG